MKLKKIELLGFKSFCERTVFHFDKGITSIVGPNGCGKSNIVDAVIWTLGERGVKALRVKEMEDVIFHGSDGRRPVNMAEVTLFFQDENNEYSVRRRIFRDGTNEYFLNGKAVRLKDIQDFFLGTGIGLNTYAIVEQGRIESFVQMKPHERKILIEEAGGITRFKEKKGEAAARLEEVKSNLERIEDIYREVQNSYLKAQKEWERWKRYMELVEKKRVLERDILLEGLRRLKRDLERTDEKQKKLKREIEIKGEEEKSLEEMIALKEEEISLNERAANELELNLRTREKDAEAIIRQIDLKKSNVHLLSKRLKEKEEKLEKTRERIRVLTQEIDKLSLRERELSEEERMKSLELEGIDEKIKKLKGEVDEAEMQLEAKRKELFVKVGELLDVNNMIVELERKRRERNERERRLKEEKENLEKRISSLSSEVLSLSQKLLSKKKELALNEEKEAETNRELERVKNEMEKKRGALHLLEAERKAKEEYLGKLGLKEEEEGETHDLKKLIELFRPEKNEEHILEKYFARELESYVIEGQDPDELVRDLKRKGNYIFFPYKGIFTKTENGVNIRFTEVYDLKEAIGRVFKGEEGIFVTSDAVVDSRGIIFMESEKGEVRIKAERERRRIKRELEDLKERMEAHSRDLLKLEEIWRRLKREADTQKGKIGSLRKEIEDIEKRIWVCKTVEKEADERLKKIRELEGMEMEETFDSEMYFSLLEKKDFLARKKMEVESEIERLKSVLLEKKGSLELLTERSKKEEIEREKRIGLISLVKSERENKKRYLDELKESEGALLLEIEESKKKLSVDNGSIESLEKSLEKVERECAAQRKRLEELKNRLGSLHLEREQLLTQIKEKRKELERVKWRLEAVEKDFLLLSEKVNQIESVLRTTYEIDPQGFEIEERSPHEMEEEKATIEREIESLGEINFRAEKEYYELKERTEFLQRQKEDLKKAMESLKMTISKIETVSRDIFFETLEKVNSYYKDFVAKLFLGGEGYLKYNAETDGVDMFARPRGKKITRMEMLSGGEKALASVALLLALIEVTPPPFSIMDEIDAPLDDANLTYLLDIIKDLSKKTQIVLITHNRLTMQVSETIYGITMEDEGISKVVSVRLAEN